MCVCVCVNIVKVAKYIILFKDTESDRNMNAILQLFKNLKKA